MGPTDTGLLAELQDKILEILTTGLSDPVVHVCDRFTNSHRKAGSPRPTSYETHTVASQKHLEGTRVTRKGEPTFTVVTAGHWPYRLTITPNKTCSKNLFRYMKRRVGSSLNRKHCKRHLVPSGKQVAYQLSRTQGSPSSLKRVPRPLHTQDTTCSNTAVVSYISKEGGMRLGPLCALLLRILTGCTRNQVTLKARHSPGRQIR